MQPTMHHTPHIQKIPPQDLPLRIPGREHHDALDRAMDPTTPWEELVQLWVDHPGAMLENPRMALKAITEGKSMYEFLPRISYVCLYVHLSRQQDPTLLARYIPEDRRIGIGRGLRDWWWFCKKSFIHELSVSYPQLLKGYVESLSRDPSIKVRSVAAERLPVHLLEPFLVDPEVEVRLRIAFNLSSHIGSLGPLWKRPEARSQHREDAFIKPVKDVIRDVRKMAQKLLDDPDEKVRVENLSGQYANDRMLLHSLGRETESFFLQFAKRYSWDNRAFPCRDELSFDALDPLFSRYPSVAHCVLEEERCSDFQIWKLTMHGDTEVSRKAWRRFKFGNPVTEDFVWDEYERLMEEGFRVSWYEDLARKEGLPRFLARQLWDQGGSVRKALFENPTPCREVVRVWGRTKTAEELIPHVSKGSSSLLTRIAARHPDPRLRAIAAQIPGHPASTLRPRLAKDSDPSVRHAVADYYLSTCVGYHGVHYNQTLSDLTRDPDPEIRQKICRDQRIESCDVKHLMADREPRVVLETLRHRPWRCYERALPLLLVEDASLRQEAAELLLEVRTYELEYAPTFFRKLEATLVNDPHPGIRCLLARDAWTSPSACHRLMEDSDNMVREALLRGFERAGECDSRAFFLHKVGKDAETQARSRNPWYRACLVRWDRRDRHRHRFLARDPHWFVRAVTASTPKLCDYLFNKLTKDPDPLVRSAAEARINPFSGNRYRKTT
jgi:hypothetical protein